MSDEKSVGLYSLTAPVVMSHPNLFEARAFGKKGKEQGEPKFSANFLFTPDSADLKELKSLCAKVARAKWPDRKFSELKFPFTDGTKLADKRKQKAGKDDGDFQRGLVVVAARSKYEPRLSAIVNGKVVDYEGPARAAAKDKFFFGAEALAQFNVMAYDGVGSNPDGVTVYLNAVLVTGKGKKIAGGGQSAAETFKGYVGSATTEDPTSGDSNSQMDDNIQF